MSNVMPDVWLCETVTVPLPLADTNALPAAMSRAADALVGDSVMTLPGVALGTETMSDCAAVDVSCPTATR